MLYKDTLDTLPSYLYFAEQIKRGEAECAEKLSIDMYQLMEKAGHAVFDCIIANFAKSSSICILAGNGNNGGDAYVVARLALQSELPVRVFCSDPNRILAGDAETARQSFLAAGGNLEKFDAFFRLSEAPSLIVDGLLGTGFSGELRTEVEILIEAVNAFNSQVIAIDLPSGLNSDTGAVTSVAVLANYTVCMVALKVGCFTADGPDQCGHMLFAGLGIDQLFVDHYPAAAELIRFETLTKIDKRRFNTHKGTYGHVICVGGDSGMAGAIFLAAKAALRSGAGKVSVLTHEENVAIVTQMCPELMVSAIGSQKATAITVNKLKLASAVILGPGLGRTSWGRSVFKQMQLLLKESDAPLILDADGLNLLSEQHSWPLKAPLVLTPHPLEAARLLQKTVQWVQSNRVEAATELSKKYVAVCVLKGTGSVVSGHSYCGINASGNPGMATAGMGDVLTGVIAANVGNRDAAADKLSANVKNAVFLHGLAGDYTAKFGEIGIIASDVIACLPKAIDFCSN